MESIKDIDNTISNSKTLPMNFPSYEAYLSAFGTNLEPQDHTDPMDAWRKHCERRQERERAACRPCPQGEESDLMNEREVNQGE